MIPANRVAPTARAVAYQHAAAGGAVRAAPATLPLRRSTVVLAAMAAAYFAGSLALAALGFDTTPSRRLLAANLAGLFAIFAAFTSMAAGLRLAMRRLRPAASSSETLATLARRSPDALIVIGLFAVLNATFWRYKNIIPDLVPFSWDAALFRLDRIIHFGDPWRILEPVLGNGAITNLLVMAYGPAWICLWLGVLTWIAWTTDEPLRRRYIVTYVLMWFLLGNVLATLLSSAGPVFFGQVAFEPNPYAGLVEHLRGSVPFLAQAQETMWQANAMRPHPPLMPPISAAPSLHVALAVLNALAVSRVSRTLGTGLWLFAAVVTLATIQLGFHYAVDAYLAVAALLPLWWATSRFTGSREAR